jgi:single-stranded DNA-binding protein
MTIECAFIGVLDRDAEVKNSSRGKPYLKLNLRAVGGDDAQWASVLSFDPEAISQAATFVKGARVYIEGRLTLHEWEDQSGAKRLNRRRLLASYAEHVAFKAPFARAG